MIKKCLKCGYEQIYDNTTPTSDCPKCGAIYEKVEYALKKERILSKKDDNIKNYEAVINTDFVILEEDEIPTDKQLDYASDLGIIVEKGATRKEVSDMISARVDKEKIATDRHLDFAKYYNVEYTKFIRKKVLFSKIFDALNKRGREKDLTAWFTYRVYRDLVHGSDDGPIDHPGHPVIQEISADLIKFDSIIKSIRRYNGEDIIWFGSWTSPSGNIFTGASNKTTAYKLASSALRQRLDLKKYSKTDRSTPNLGNIQKANSKKSEVPDKYIGCGAMIFVAILLIIIMRACR